MTLLTTQISKFIHSVFNDNIRVSRNITSGITASLSELCPTRYSTKLGFKKKNCLLLDNFNRDYLACKSTFDHHFIKQDVHRDYLAHTS